MPRLPFLVPLLLFFLFAPAARAAETGCPDDALGVARTVAVGAPGGLQIGLKTYPQTLALADHEVVLTFDDGPVPATTAKVLAALAKQCVKATFFLIGRNAAANPGLVKREIAEGHMIGHHSFSHPDRTLRRMSDSAARADIDKGFAADDIAAYGSAADAPKVRFFRFPGFADTPALVDWLSGRNIAVFGADLWASDWLDMTPAAELALVLARFEQERRGILLLHDSKAATAAMLPELLSALKTRGYKIVHLVPGDATPATRSAPDGWTSETEKIIADVFAREKARSVAKKANTRTIAPAPDSAAPHAATP